MDALGWFERAKKQDESAQAKALPLRDVTDKWKADIGDDAVGVLGNIFRRAAYNGVIRHAFDFPPVVPLDAILSALDGADGAFDADPCNGQPISRNGFAPPGYGRLKAARLGLRRDWFQSALAELGIDPPTFWLGLVVPTVEPEPVLKAEPPIVEWKNVMLALVGPDRIRVEIQGQGPRTVVLGDVGLVGKGGGPTAAFAALLRLGTDLPVTGLKPRNIVTKLRRALREVVGIGGDPFAKKDTNANFWPPRFQFRNRMDEQKERDRITQRKQSQHRERPLRDSDIYHFDDQDDAGAKFIATNEARTKPPPSYD